MDKGVPIRSISRSIAVLQAINRGASLSMMDIARSSELPYPTACRIVQTLVHEGMIEREPARRRYRPTAMVQTLAHGFQGDAHLVTTARPHIVDLTRRVGWPISLSTHVGHSMIIRDSTHALTALTFNYYYPGYALPILECAAGLAYLSHMPTEELATLLNALKLLPKRANLHVIDLFENGTLVADIRSAGFATREFNRFTSNPGKTSSIAIPIMRGAVVYGALTLPFFSASTHMAEAVAQFSEPLRETAIAIAEEL